MKRRSFLSAAGALLASLGLGMTARPSTARPVPKGSQPADDPPLVVLEHAQKVLIQQSVDGLRRVVTTGHMEVLTDRFTARLLDATAPWIPPVPIGYRRIVSRRSAAEECVGAGRLIVEYCVVDEEIPAAMPPDNG